MGGEWKDYSNAEDKILKRAFMAGFPSVRFVHRGQSYTYDFRKMIQINAESRKERQIRAPRKWKQPSKPVCPAGPTTVITVPPGSPGTTILVPHPRSKGAFIAVNVPRNAKPGQAMLVPVPSMATSPSIPKSAHPAATDTASKKEPREKSAGSWTTGGTVAAGAVGAAAMGCAYVGGIVLGDHIYDHGIDATVDVIGDGLEDAGEAVADVAVDAGEFVVDAAEDLGEFVMDLF